MPDNAVPLVLLTRPRAQSERFATTLADAFGEDIEIAILPLQEIVPTGAVPSLDGIGALIFTSENGVRVFADASGERDLPAWCVGPRTEAVARDLGFDPRAGGGDAAALVTTILAAPDDGPLLHLRGAHARGEIAERLRAAGRDAREAVIYRQEERAPDRPIAPMANARTVIVPLFSPRSAALFAAIQSGAPGDWRLVCLSEAVAEALPEPLRSLATVAERPDAGALVTALTGHIYP
ncbi:uroporphyrinogen-III synthase [Rhodobacterales bacterium HKCCE3408]|nr:uroporphyrinogen-III synthase [Rhodobacterales bacterium HKCCE3408]